MEPFSRTEVRDLYDTSVGAYADIMDSEVQLPLYTDVLCRLAERIAGLPGAVIDTACGTGHMLWRYQAEFDPQRRLVGIDLSPSMMASARARLDGTVQLQVGDMCELTGIASGSGAGVINYFALHHLAPEEAVVALREWQRVLVPGGQLLLATWEGTGEIDYGDSSDVVALQYPQAQLDAWVQEAGFVIDRSVVEDVPEMGLKALYLEAFKPW